MRKLASIQLINKIEPIEGADRIEKATVLGWHVVVQKGLYREGDKVVYLEIDSVLPKELAERANFTDSHLKTRRFKGVYSQGMCLPLTELPEKLQKGAEVGQDVTKELGITKWEPDQRNDEQWWKHHQNAAAPKKWYMKYRIGRWFWKKFLYKPISGPFPSDLVPKTDETRCLYGKTKVWTEMGQIPVSTLVNQFEKYKDVKVLSVAPDGTLEYKEIEAVQKFRFDPKTEKMYDIQFNMGPYRHRVNRVRCTADHKFFLGDKYVPASELKTGDTIYTQAESYGEEVIPFIYGGLLGDCGLSFENRPTVNGVLLDAPIISFSQGEDQLEYLLEKQKALGEGYLKIRESKSGYCDKLAYQGSFTRDAKIFETLLDDGAVANRKFQLTKAFVDRLTPLSLAIWYLDDGSLKHRCEEHCSPSIIISSCQFTEEENKLLVDRLNEMGYKSNIRQEKGYWSIYVTTEGTPKLLRDITKYIPENMRYKTLPSLESIPYEGYPSFSKSPHLIKVAINNITEFVNKNIHTVYDITVKDNHNFFASNVLTHNCQILGDVLEKYKGIKCQYTEKLDGSSITFWKDKKGKFHVCSRNREIFNEQDFMYETASRLAERIEPGYVYQGEILGPNIQGNKYGLKDYDIYIYQVYEPEAKVYMTPAMLTSHLEWHRLKQVPVLGEFELTDDIDQLVEMAIGMSVLEGRGKDTQREGIVIRPLEYIDGLYDKRFVGGRLSFKAINPKFLIKYNL